ncbi:MAG: lactate dehydrogenase [Acidimicrobiaceae bacterium]|nr:lactate dehydrogenase [Acidimicrobiaceae bacterium]
MRPVGASRRHPAIRAMSTHRISTRPPRGDPGARPDVLTDPDDVAPYLEDAAHYPGGQTPAVVRPTSEAELAVTLRRGGAVLPVGAQSSLTGGATPRGETVVSLGRLDSLEVRSSTRLLAGPGVTLTAIRERLAGSGSSYPPVPTYEGATVGGIVATDAAGAATFKYGTTRRWVRGLTVMLASGELIDLERGEVTARDGRFELVTAQGVVPIPVPSYRMPDVPKHSAGYHAETDLDLVDLFIGAEGTLGVVTSVTLDLLPAAPSLALAVIGVTSESQAVTVTEALRRESETTRGTRDPRGLDVVAIEHMDRRCLDLVREDGIDRRLQVALPPEVEVMLLAQLELPDRLPSEQLHDEVARSLSSSAPDTPITRLCRLLDQAALLETTELVGPTETGRFADLLRFREAVPEAVNRRVGQAQRRVDPSIHKTAADMIVPFPRLSESVALFREAFRSRGLDHAIWGHISDANLHPNLLPRTAADVALAREAIVECGREIVAMGGSPLAEHGVGRNPTKQRLLALLHGADGIAEMRAVKQALDPDWKLAPGVLFGRTMTEGTSA